MTNLIVVNDISHAIGGGRSTEEEATSMVNFYRNGYNFSIHTSQSDIAGTRFEKQWSQTIVEPRDDTSIQDWSQRSGQLCHLVISQSLPLLDELSRGDNKWQTIEDYLRTTSYEIKLVRSDDTGEPSAIVINGPVLRPAFGFQPYPQGEHALDIPAAIPRFDAVEVVVCDRSDDYRRAPHKVKIPNGRAHFLMPFEVSATHLPENYVRNQSLNTISAHLQAYKKELSHCLPEITGVVLTDTQPYKGREVDALLWGSSQTTGKNVAGILLKFITHALPLSEMLDTGPRRAKFREPWAIPPAWEKQQEKPKVVPTSDQINEWEQSLGHGIKILHENNIVVQTIHASNLFISPKGPFIGKLGGVLKKAIPQYNQEFIKRTEQEAAEDAKIEERGEVARKKKSHTEQRNEKLEAIGGYKIELGNIEEQKKSDWVQLETTFRRLREAQSIT